MAKIRAKKREKYAHMQVRDFFYNTSLTAERRRDIVKWVNSLTRDQQRMLDELRRDAIDDAQSD